MLIPWKALQSCGLYITSYGHCKEIASTLHNVYLPSYGHYNKSVSKVWTCIQSYRRYKEVVSKFKSVHTILSSLQGKHVKVTKYIYHRMVTARKASQSCEIYTPSYGH